MPSTRNIVRIFLASPGDLGDERKLAKTIVDEFNANNADYLGYQIELLGWEDTVSQQGRAQEIINRDLLKCDLFVGLMWKRWGTAPSATGPYTSGFEEEYNLAKTALRERGRPDMKLYFRQIEPEARLDPGDGLKKVMAFQEAVAENREIYFETFSSTDDFRRRFNRAITVYIHELNELNQEKTSNDSADTAPILAIEHQTDLRPRSLEAGFLETLSQALASDSNEMPDAVAVARLRTLAASIPRSGNDQQYVGVHDSNLMYSARHKISLSSLEIQALVDAALAHMSNQYVPLYYWLPRIKREAGEYLTVTSWVAPTDNERIGALRVLKWMALPLHAEYSTPAYWQAMFSDETSYQVKKALLEYLETMGTSDNIPTIIKELERSNYGTVGAALRAAALLISKSSILDSTEFILSQQFQDLDKSTAEHVLLDPGQAEENLLRRAMGHRSPVVRRWAIDGLLRHQLLSDRDIEALKNDADANIRWIALRASIDAGSRYSDEEAKRLLVRATTSYGLGFGAGPARDALGEENFQNFRRYQAGMLSTKKPESVPEFSSIDSSYEYFGVVDRHFSTFVRDLENAVDDRFEAKFQQVVEAIDRVVANGGPSSLSDDYRKLSAFVRKQWLSTGLEILQRRGGKDQFERIRSALSDDFSEAQPRDIDYLGRYGTWEDIPLVLALDSKQAGLSLVMIGSGQRPKTAARAIYRMAKGKFDATFGLDIPPTILKEVVRNSTLKERRALSNELVMSIFLNEDDDLRAVAAAAMIEALPQARVKSIMSEYERLDRKRYYNVIHWLDLGASMKSTEAKKIAGKALLEL